jgi:hypothetical protein
MYVILAPVLQGHPPPSVALKCPACVPRDTRGRQHAQPAHTDALIGRLASAFNLLGASWRASRSKH